MKAPRAGSVRTSSFGAAVPTAEVTPTMAPLWLGSIAASLQAMQVELLLRGEHAQSILGRELYFDLASGTVVTSRLVRNPKCLFDHAAGPAVPIGDVRVHELFTMARDAKCIRALHRRFFRPLACEACGESSGSGWRFARSLAEYAATCHCCETALVATAMDVTDGLFAEDLRNRSLALRRLSELDLREGDLLVAELPAGTILFERRSDRAVPVRGPRQRRLVPHRDSAVAGDEDCRTVVVVGLGNIGSSLVDAIVHGQRPPFGGVRSGAGSGPGTPAKIDRLVLIDPDSYDDSNLWGQRIEPGDVDHPKALVQARRARALRPFLSVVAFVARADQVPPGVFARAIVAGCVDSRSARMTIGETAWRVGSPFIDAAVDATIPAVRLAGYAPGDGSADIECGFDRDDYAVLEQTTPCIH